MTALPWTTVIDPEPDHEYVVMATRFVVSSRRHLLGVMGATQELWRSLPTTAGLVGHGFAVAPLRGTLSTLTAWHDRESLRRFVRGPLHASLVTATSPLMRDSRFAEWTTPGTELPPSWTTANRRLTGTGSGRTTGAPA